ncbi:MAG: LLM class flavin-dependent oxidoreductase [Acidimicrobiales bacterium]
MVKLGLGLETWSSATAELPIDRIRRAEAVGFDSVWSAEAYGADALVPLGYIAGLTQRIRLATGLLQLAARPATTAAMSLATLDRLAGGGRVIAGLGLSGPQVVEGWYGQPWSTRPLARLRDYVTIMRKTLERAEPVRHVGPEIQIPYVGDGASGLAKPLKSILHPQAPVPIWLAGGGPQAVRLAAEIGDGWLPMGFHPGSMAHYQTAFDAGFARRTDGMTRAQFTVWAILPVVRTDDVAATIAGLKPSVAMFAGGMGAKGKNFHREQMERCGFPDEAERVEEYWRAGERQRAAEAVPDDYLDSTRLIGSDRRIAERWSAWENAGADGYTLFVNDDELVDLMADLAGTRDQTS